MRFSNVRLLVKDFAGCFKFYTCLLYTSINGSYLRSYFLMASESHVPEIVPFYSNAITQFIADSIDQWLYIHSDIVLFKGFINNNLHLGFPWKWLLYRHPYLERRCFQWLIKANYFFDVKGRIVRCCLKYVWLMLKVIIRFWICLLYTSRCV